MAHNEEQNTSTWGKTAAKADVQSPFFLYFFTHFVQDERKHVLLPVMKEKNSNQKLYIYKIEGSITTLLLWPNHWESNQKIEEIAVMSLPWVEMGTWKVRPCWECLQLSGPGARSKSFPVESI